MSELEALWKIPLTVLIVAANAFFVGAEFALVKVRVTQLEELADRGSRAATLALRIVGRIDEYLSAAQVGITAASLALGWIAEPFFAALLLLALGPLGPLSDAFVHALSFAVAFALITYVHIVVGEQAPKYLAIQRALPIVLLSVYPLHWFFTATSFFTRFVNVSANLVLRPFGARRGGEVEALSEEELRLQVASWARAGILQESERELLRNVLEFADKMVRQVMVPRTEVVAVEATATVQDVVELAGRHPYTRFPVYREDLDHVVGVVHLRDVVSLPPDALRRTRVTQVMRRVVAVPETMRLDRALAEMRLQRTPLFLVIDEFGGTAGLVTMEDVLEELVGELRDEFDRTAPQVRTAPDGSLVIDGLTSLDDIRERLGLALEDEPYDTIGGLVFGRLGRVAKLGDFVEIEGVRFEVTAMDGRRVAQVRARRGPQRAVRAG